MQFENLKTIVAFAISKEKEAAEFYEEISRREDLSGSREMLAEFAHEERKHQKMLEEIETKGISQEVIDYKLKWIPDLKRSDYAVELEYKKGMGYSELLLLAMKREEAALKLYNQLLVQAEGREVQKFFKMLCQEEAKHKLALETLL